MASSLFSSFFLIGKERCHNPPTKLDRFYLFQIIWINPVFLNKVGNTIINWFFYCSYRKKLKQQTRIKDNKFTWSQASVMNLSWDSGVQCMSLSFSSWQKSRNSSYTKLQTPTVPKQTQGSNKVNNVKWQHLKRPSYSGFWQMHEMHLLRLITSAIHYILTI